MTSSELNARLDLKAKLSWLTHSETPWRIALEYLRGELNHDYLVCVLKGIYPAALAKKLIALVEKHEAKFQA